MKRTVRRSTQWARAFTAAVMLLIVMHARPTHAADHFPFGALSAPREVPAWMVTTADGAVVPLPHLLKGHVTAVQLMFTSCNAICPLQGATFAKAQTQLGHEIADAQFVSISIDPGTDTPVAMHKWLQTFDAKAGWTGVTPKPSDLVALQAVLGEGGMAQPQGADPHSGQVYIINREGMLVFRTAAMPSASGIVAAMRTVARQ